MRKSQHIIVAIIILITLFSAKAQDATPINLQKALELGGANNLTIKEIEQRKELASANLSKAKEWWLPNIYAGLQTHQLWGAVLNGNGNFFLDVNRNSFWGGLGLNANWNFSEGIYKTKSENLKVQASQYEEQAGRNKTLLQIISAYYNLQVSQLKFIAFKNLTQQSDTIVEQIEIQVNAGLRYQSELLLSKSNRNHLKIEMLNSQNEYNKASAELVRLLNLETKTKFVSVDTFMLPLDLQQELFLVFDTAYKNRPEIKASELNLRSLQIEQKTVTTGLLIPQLGVGTYGSYFGRINGNVSPMFPLQYPETKQLYPTGTFNVSLLWNIPLGRFAYGGDLKKYNSLIKIQEIKTEQLKSEINTEITTSYQQILLGKEQIQIAKDAVLLTSEALNQSIERQKLGTAKPFEVFQAQQFYLQSQIDYLKAVSEYNKAQFNLKVASGNNLF